MWNLEINSNESWDMKFYLVKQFKDTAKTFMVAKGK